MGRDPRNRASSQKTLYFNPRALVGRDSGRSTWACGRPYFNPRALVGRDSVLSVLDDRDVISIHAPSWGATNSLISDSFVIVISIHAPSWGATKIKKQPPRKGGISIHAPSWGATTAVNRYYLARMISIHAPSWGATAAFNERKAKQKISIHAPSWGATVEHEQEMQRLKFQSTRPRGARPSCMASAAQARHFNPRALVGRDSACLHGLNYSGHAIFFANLIFSRAVTGIFRRKVLCVIRVRTEILRLFSRRRCLLQHQSSFSFITWFCTDVLRFSCVFIA